ncbi:uncharacterized protein LOC143248352 isoform X2 [Tachypleus tridentatus]|uniref:uncharacterized protein LOC143248352 isoform X2 n=1 Tax=Tachypleus tridentatus TaxID=6853 RepID=UPI003FD21131
MQSRMFANPQTKMYPVTGECWHDMSSPFSLSLMANSDKLGTVFSTTTTNRSYCSMGITSTSALLSSQTNINDVYYSGSVSSNGLISNDHPSTGITEELPYSISCAGGTSNIGTAMAVSLAALTNGTDPTAEGMMSVMYDYDFQEFVCGDNTSAVVPPALQLPSTGTSLTLDQLNTPPQPPTSNQEYPLPELLMDDDLHIVDVSDNAEDSYTFPSHLNLQFGCVEKSVGNSGDSAVPSLDPNRFHSLSKARSQDSFIEAEQLNQPVIDPHYFDIQDQRNNYLSNTFVHQNLNSSPTLGNESCWGDVLASGSNALHVDSFLQDNYCPLSIDGTHSLQKSSTRKSIELSGTESDNRDEKLSRALKLPLSNKDIIVLPIDEFNEKLSKYELTEAQLSLIRDIRRRGKNKVAAQNCRKRKLDQIVGLTKELEMLQSDKIFLCSEQERLLNNRTNLQKKYEQLYQVVLQNTQHHLAASLYTPHHSQVIFDSGAKSEVEVQRVMNKIPAD